METCLQIEKKEKNNKNVGKTLIFKWALNVI